MEGEMKAMRMGNSGVLLMVGGAAALAFIVRDHLATPYDPLFEEKGRKWNVPPNLLRAVARVESGFKPGAINQASHDYGLMQINQIHFARLGLTSTSILDPATNVDAGARILSEMRSLLGERFSLYAWAMSYNTGPDLSPRGVGDAYAAGVMYHWQLYDWGRIFA